MCVEAFFLVRRKLIGQGGGRGEARKGAQEGQEGEEDQHVDGRTRSAVLGGRPDGTRDGDERWCQSVRLFVALVALLLVEGSLPWLLFPNEDTHAGVARRSSDHACVEAAVGVGDVPKSHAFLLFNPLFSPSWPTNVTACCHRMLKQ